MVVVVVVVGRRGDGGGKERARWEKMIAAAANVHCHQAVGDVL